MRYYTDGRRLYEAGERFRGPSVALRDVVSGLALPVSREFIARSMREVLLAPDDEVAAWCEQLRAVR